MSVTVVEIADGELAGKFFAINDALGGNPEFWVRQLDHPDGPAVRVTHDVRRTESLHRAVEIPRPADDVPRLRVSPHYGPEPLSLR
jgi:hypothetical protein